MTKLIGLLVVLTISAELVSAQTQSVSFCPLYLALQNRCPTPSTTVAPSTIRTTTTGDEADYSDESDVVDSCGAPVITFCPAMQLFLSGNRTCAEGQAIQISLTTLGRLLVRPSTEKAARVVGATNVDALGDAFTSISKTIQATPTQATIGVTFIPVGQIIG